MLAKLVKNVGRYVKYKPKYYEDTSRKLREAEKRRIILFATPNSGNLGDHAIAEAAKTFFEDNLSDDLYTEFSIHQYKYDKEHIQRKVNDEDIVVITGGGFLGNLWLLGENTVRDIIERFPNNKIVILPQTMFFDKKYDKEAELAKSVAIYNNHPNLTIFLRDERSYEKVLEHFPSIAVRRAPDIVTYMKHEKTYDREGALFCFRDDKEKLDYSHIVADIKEYIESKELTIKYTDTVISEKVDEKNRTLHLNNKYKEFGSSKIVITDRLHGMIFALITGTPCIAFNNSTGKVKGVYEWLKSSDHLVVLDNEDKYSADQIKKSIDYLLSLETNGYDTQLVQKHFEILVNEFKN